MVGPVTHTLTETIQSTETALVEERSLFERALLPTPLFQRLVIYLGPEANALLCTNKQIHERAHAFYEMYCKAISPDPQPTVFLTSTTLYPLIIQVILFLSDASTPEGLRSEIILKENITENKLFYWSILKAGLYLIMQAPRDNKNQYERAYQYLNTASIELHDYAPAYYALSLCNHDGRGIDQNYTLSFHHMKCAADLGMAQAQTVLARFYEEGTGVAISKANAFDYYKLAADQGYSKAFSRLADLYYHGTGTEQNIDLHVQYTKKAAKAGIQKAIKLIAHYYDTGLHVPQNYNKALKYYHLVRQQGSAEACFKIGHYYENGLGGLKQNLHIALEWYLSAKGRGYEDAAEACKRIQEQL